MTNEQAKKHIVAYMYYADDLPEVVARAFDVAIEALKTERPKGEWEDSHIYSCGKILKGRNDVIEHKCSVCKRWSIKWDGTIPDNYCSHCGADMRGDNNG